MKIYVLSLCLLATVAESKAQQAEDSVRATIISLFECMYRADAAAMKDLFHDSAQLATVTTDAAGNPVLRNSPASGFIGYVTKLTPGNADERAFIERVMIDGPLAIAWTPYKFYSKGTYSHCGVNVIQLVRTPARWKILNITDTRRKDHCRE